MAHIRSPRAVALRWGRQHGLMGAVRLHHQEANPLDAAGQEAAFTALCATYNAPPGIRLTDELWEEIADRIWDGIQRAARKIHNG